MTFVTRQGSDVCIALIKKGANTSIHQWVMTALNPLELTNAQAATYLYPLAFFRDPVERVKSGFSHFYSILYMGMETDILPTEAVYVQGRGMQENYEAFIDHILVNHDDHWNTQLSQVLNGQDFIPKRLHRLEDLNDFAETYFRGALPWVNRWSRIQSLDHSYRASELLTLYADDLTIWNAIPAGGQLQGSALNAVIAGL